MTDREPAGQSKSSGPQSYESEAEYWFSEKPTYMWSGRIRGLFADELGEWLPHLPEEAHVIQDIEIRRDELFKMDELTKEEWAKQLTKADKNTFESFVDREQSKEVLTLIVEAEADTENPRAERIGYVNKRKAQLK